MPPKRTHYLFVALVAPPLHNVKRQIRRGGFGLPVRGPMIEVQTMKTVRLVWVAASVVAVSSIFAAALAQDGVLPAGPSGKPLNLDFEAGDLRDWKAEGEAFAGQPIRGDTVAPRRDDMKSEHAGQFWIGGYERAGDKPQGTLVSTAFRVTRPWASFLVAGGPHETTCVELVRADTKQVFFKASGHETENLERVVVDLSPHVGKEIFIRVVDRHSGHWGHINFDDFRLHDTKPQLPNRAAQSPADVFKFAGLSPEEAAKAMTVPEGFKVALFAGEPDVVQPIAMAIDDRGRVWVAEAYSYPARVPDDQAKDRILIFEDKDGDGKFDERKVFADKLNLVSGLELGFGGVWVGAAPYLMFIPDKDGDDVPDGKPEILLDGWGYQDTHETLNAFTWGPDGWLYGCHGVFTHSRVGKPGTPDVDRVPLNAGIWRYHPTKHTFEVFAHGTSNPWGVDFNDYGQCFLTACVIPHLYHIVQGARYERQGGQHFNPYTYDDIKTIADHRHYVGNQWRDADRAKSDDQGGGHAHAGAMIYLGGTWPEKYRGAIFMNNIHGARINMDTLTPSGSGYIGSHGPDFIKTNDLWSQIINLQYGPDGNVYMIDWYDKNQCHRGERDAHDRSNGRIFKVSYVGDAANSVRSTQYSVLSTQYSLLRGGDLKKLSDLKLAEMQVHPNDWYVRHARRILQERAAAGKLDDAVTDLLGQIAFTHDDETRCLRALWALHVTDRLFSNQLVEKALNHKNAHVRAWFIQCLLQEPSPTRRPSSTSPILTRPGQIRLVLSKVAASDPSPIVRLYTAAGLSRLSVDERWPIVRNLIRHSEDAADPNLPLMIWYAMEPLAEVDANLALHPANHSEIPILLQFMARRVTSIGTPEAIAVVIERMTEMDDARKRLAFLKGMSEALQGRRQVEMPKGWPALFADLHKSGDGETRRLADGLAVTFGDPKAMESLRKTLADAKADVEQRREAIQSLLAARDPGLAATLQKLIADPPLRRDALRGLAVYDDPKTASVILGVYPSLALEEKRDALNTLASRAGTARALVAAVAEKKVPTTDLSADVLRHLRNIKDAELTKQIASVWGSLRDTAEDKVREIRRVRGMLAARQAGPDELPRGRAVFAKTCQQCHTLFGSGAKIGPDLTGSNRADLEYLLSNVLDPSAVMAREYQPQLIATTDGRVITGLVLKDDGKTMTVATANDTITLPHSDIDEMKLSDKSMMPDDLLRPLADDDVRALVAYLATPAQAPMLATADNAKSFWNGVDLAGWDGDADLWSVERGNDGVAEIVGKTATGIKHNEFLRSHMLVEDFKLTLKVKLTPNAANSGIQFRSEPIAGGEMRGPQADIGAGWWGKLYEENGRGLLWDKSGEPHVRPGEWNDYAIIAAGSRVQTFINGKLCVDLDDPPAARRGIIALQIHSGGATEVRFKELKLELLQ
jgi:putative membrane-bound dehydrogenase-like protein